jgi:hypothetical protein
VLRNVVQSRGALVTSGFLDMLSSKSYQIYQCSSHYFGETTVTYYNVISENATRAVWNIGGFQNNQVFEENPLTPSLKIYVEPTNNEFIGETFVIVVTVYNKHGDSATATKQFTVVSNNP